MDDPSKILTFIVPGYLAIWVYRTLRPNKRRGDLELTLWAILWSSLLTFFAGFFYPPVSLAVHHLGIPYWGQGSLARVLFASAIGFLIGGSLGGLLNLLRRQDYFVDCLGWLAVNWRINLLSFFRESRVWNNVMARPPGYSWVLVTLQNGKMYVGQIEQYTLDPNVEQLELHLRTYSILNLDPVTGAEGMVPAEGFGDIWIPASQISTVQFFDDDAQRRLSGLADEPIPDLQNQPDDLGHSSIDNSSGQSGISNSGQS